MRRIAYPLLYFKLRSNALLGLLVGSDYQVMDKDLKGIKSTLSDHLHKQYKKHDDYPYIEMLEPKLKVIDVKIRPTYKGTNSSYPLKEAIKVPVIAVYGETANNYYECYLPMLSESFYYYESKQLNTLIQHFATNVLNQFTPEHIYKYLLYQKPQLDTIHLKVNENKGGGGWGNWNYTRRYETLESLAEKYPYSKAIKRNISAFPEAAWELEDKVSELVDKLVTTRSNVLLVGKSGVGKSSILKQAIKKISTKNKKSKINLSFWQIMPQRITAQAKYLGEWQETCEDLVEELNTCSGVLWVVDFIRLLQIGGRGPEDSVAAFLTPFLQQGRLQVVGEVTEPQLESIRRLLPGFIESFQIIKVEELPEQRIFTILDKFSAYCKKNLKMNIARNGLELSYRLLVRYYPYQSFPGKAIRFLGQCVSEAQINEVDNVSKTDTIQQFIKNTGLPELFLRDDMLLESDQLNTHFSSKIIGQPAAIEQLSGVVKIFKAGLNNPFKPITTMIFAGPTGVGKTASARALADYFFGVGQQRSPLIRIDMSEFQHPSQIARFIGAGFEVGKLVQEVRERPFSVLLLDEVEKADASIFDALLTVLDEGMLVDAFGRITNFRNTIIIMTTNLGASNGRSIGYGNAMPDDVAYESAIGSFFRPEFVNRIDQIVMFNPLGAKEIRKITLKELEDLKQREGFTKRNLTLNFTDNIVKHLSAVGFDERYGARPLQRAIEREIVAPFAKWLLQYPKLKSCQLLVDFEEELKITIEGR